MQTDRLKTPGHFAGFDGLRLVAAVAVMFSHSFLIATGSEATEPFVRLLGPGNIVGLYGVFTFFIISGFLLARSLSAGASSISYTVNRVSRILPGFAFQVVVVALVIGPLFSSLRVGEYLASPEIPEFVKDALNGLGDAQLPGVFGYDAKGDLATVVNGSLWSLRYEAQTYVFLLLLWTLLGESRIVAGVIALIAVLTWTLPPVVRAIVGVAYTLPYFAGGVVMNWIHRRYGTNLYGAAVSVVLLLLAAVFNLQVYAFALFGAYLVVFLGERRNLGSRFADRMGDCSYGVYLYGWPAEQMVKQLTLTTDPMRLLVLALPVSFVLALISCHLIERPAMRPKRAVAAWIASWISSLSARRAAVLGAKASFVAGTTMILVSPVRSWQFLESMGQVVIGVIVGSIVAVALYHAAEKLGIREAAIWRGKA